MDIVGWTVLIGNVTISDLHFLDLISVSAHGAQHADTLSCSFESFSFQFLCTVFGTTKREISGTPDFPN